MHIYIYDVHNSVYISMCIICVESAALGRTLAAEMTAHIDAMMFVCRRACRRSCAEPPQQFSTAAGIDKRPAFGRQVLWGRRNPGAYKTNEETHIIHKTTHTVNEERIPALTAQTRHLPHPGGRFWGGGRFGAADIPVLTARVERLQTPQGGKL